VVALTNLGRVSAKLDGFLLSLQTRLRRLKNVPLHFLDLTLPTPAENLACDEALLDEAEANGAQEVLRFWEVPAHFVVLGYANKRGEEVDIEACQAQRVPILRRCSGGGTVLQGPGCLNYSVVLKAGDTPELQSITGANRFVMERNRTALVSLTGKAVTIEGHTDLATDGLKFSGNAQRRKREWLLFHGTFLLNFDVALIEKLLRPPPRQPTYRRGRSHLRFLTRLDVSADALKSALREAWSAHKAGIGIPHERIARLVTEKYSRDEWNLSR
jgi:lipoate-protein ligase A